METTKLKVVFYTTKGEHVERYTTIPAGAKRGAIDAIAEDLKVSTARAMGVRMRRGLFATRV